MSDIAHLLKVVGSTEVEQAIEVLAEFLPKSAQIGEAALRAEHLLAEMF